MHALALSFALAFTVNHLAPGVYGLVWPEAVNPEPNVLIVVNEDDVVVVDSSMFPSTAKAIIGEIRKLTPKPVRYVVNTHWHDDHVFGNFVYREAWPNVEFIAHADTKTDAAEQAFGAIPQDLVNNRELLAKYREMLKGDLTPERRNRVENVVSQFEQYDREIPRVRMQLPDVTFTDRLVLERGSRTIELRYLGRGNTRGDIVVFLPKEKIVATGDLVVAPVPFGIGSYYHEWSDTLGRLAALDAGTFFLSHGQPLHDTSYIAQLRELLDSMTSQVDAAVAAGKSLEEIQSSVTLADWKKRFAGDDEALQRAFDAYFVQPAVEREVHLAKHEPVSP